MIRRLRHLARGWRPGTGGSQEQRNLAVRVDHLESVVEGLQDAVYRQAQQHDRDVEELRRRTDPSEVARALSADARKRGL